MNAGGFPYLTLHWLTAGSTCVHIQSSSEKCGSIWWPWRRCMCTTVLQHAQSCTALNIYAHTLFQFLFFFYMSMCAHIQSQCEVGSCRKYIQEFKQYVLYVFSGFHHLSYSHSLLPLALLFSPVWPYLHSATVQGGNDEKWSYNASC